MARPAQGTLFDTFDFGTPQTRNGKKGNSRWRTAIIYGLLILLLLVSFVGFFLYRFDPFSKPTFPTEAVLKGTFIDTIDVNGTLTPRKQEIVTTTLTGPISEIWVAEGDMVDEGQALFEVDTGQGYTDVTAPIAGQIVQLNLSTGKSYGEQNGALSPGLIIADLSLMEVSLDVNEVDIPHIELGQGAVLSFDALPDLTLNATVAHVATLPNEGAAAAGLAPGGIVVTYPVTLGLEQDDSRLKPGMSVSARITVNEITDVLLVNALAIDNLDDSTVVYVQEPSGEVVSVEVDVLASSPTQIAVEGELAEGEQVVIDRGDTGAGTRSDLFMVRSRFSG
ncbi:MAG: efflux RND transporter periplasmic adaptor subunit [Coriobacteriales bacterium]|nr:efflux RND transporter periplasmic adaptor subunit [Coriobacteriales bacterium]